MEGHRELLDIDPSTVPRFSFKGDDVIARVCSIHDPDTITVIFKKFNQYVKVNVRLDGIDAPELNSKIASEKEACVRGTERLNEMIGNKLVQVKLLAPDKYGRTLGIVYALDPPCCINDYLIEYQYVRKYGGGKKQIWSSEELERVGTSINKD